MPWDHCGQTVMDDQRCPECGISKDAWTIKLDKTRLFQLSATPYEGDADAHFLLGRAAAAGGLSGEAARFYRRTLDLLPAWEADSRALVEEALRDLERGGGRVPPAAGP